MPIEELVALINQQRTVPLWLSPPLSEVSQLHSEKMATTGLLDHTGFMQRAHDAGFDNVPVAENLAEADTPQAVYEMWMKSPPHKKNMLNETYTLCGVGQSGRWWTLLLVQGKKGMLT